jgi:hypothetical protein
VDIIGIGNVSGLSNVLQSTDADKPALLSVSIYLDAWPNSVMMMDATKATIYESPCQTTKLSSSQMQKALPHWKIIAVFQQINKIYIAPNYMFQYSSQTKSIKSTTSLIFNDLDRKSISA